MLFNFGKCKCLHTGPGNTGMNYEMGGTILSKTMKELGVSMNANMKVSEQCRIAASKGNQVLGMIRRNITYKEKSLIVPLYKAIVRPHLEYCIQGVGRYERYEYDELDIFFEIKESKITRGHNLLVRNRVDWMLGSFHFHRGPSLCYFLWNKLSSECVHASSVNMFKNRIDKYLVKAGYT